MGELYKLGLGDVFGVSAEHGRGIEDLLGKVLALLPDAPALESEAQEKPDEEAAAGAVRLAIVGRPNVGKSTLVNALLKQKRLVASEVPGTTRDPIDSEIEFKRRRFVLTDTAGIRRKKAIAQKVEQFSVVAALRVIDRSDVAVLLMDATEPAVDQDAKIAGIAEEKGRALLIVINKWDLVARTSARQEALRDELKYKLKFVAYAPLIFTSALTGAEGGEGAGARRAAVRPVPLPRADAAAQPAARAHDRTNHPAPIVDGQARCGSITSPR